MSAGAAGAAAAAAAEARRRLQQEEEEEMTYPTPDGPIQYEYKIIRSARAAFKDPHKFRAALEAEAEAGWELVEKFDNSRVRLRRDIRWRDRDASLVVDAYRTYVGITEEMLTMWIVLVLFGGIAAVLLLIGVIAAVIS